MLSKKDAKVKVELYRNTMAHLIGVPVVISLGPHEFPLVLADMQLAAVAQLALQPEKVYSDETGKNQTPQVMQLVFSSGESICIVMDDVEEFNVGITGAVFKIGSEELKISHDTSHGK